MKVKLWMLMALLTWTHPRLIAKPAEIDTISARFFAFAPNAGGQEIYAASYLRQQIEYTLFLNRSVSAGTSSLAGGTASFRFYALDYDHFWQLYAQAGAGLSTGGPLAEILWGLTIPMIPLWLPTGAPKYVPQIRIDVANQFYFSKTRAITWSVPLWLGFSVPF